MFPTHHAKQRWKERFPAWDMKTEYQLSRGIGRGAMFKRIVEGLHWQNKLKLLRNGGTCYMLLSKRSGAVFVMDRGQVVITVLQLSKVDST